MDENQHSAEFGDAQEAFDHLLSQETRSLSDGIVQGSQDGEASGYLEGFAFGFSKGAEIGNEIGFYRGFLVEAKRYYETMDTTKSSESMQRKLQSIDQLLENIAHVDLRDIRADSISDSILTVRRKFKQVFPGAYKPKSASDVSTSF